MSGGHGPMASVVARAYNGGLGAERPVGPRGRAPGQGMGAKPSWSWSNFGFFGCSMEAANLAIFLKFGNANKLDICVIFAKNHGWPRNWAERAWSKNRGLCPQPWSKTATGFWMLQCVIQHKSPHSLPSHTIKTMPQITNVCMHGIDRVKCKITEHVLCWLSLYWLVHIATAGDERQKFRKKYFHSYHLV